MAIPFNSHWYVWPDAVCACKTTGLPWHNPAVGPLVMTAAGKGFTTTGTVDEVASQPAADVTFTPYEPDNVAVNEVEVADEMGAPFNNHW